MKLIRVPYHEDAYLNPEQIVDIYYTKGYRRLYMEESYNCWKPKRKYWFFGPVIKGYRSSCYWSSARVCISMSDESQHTIKVASNSAAKLLVEQLTIYFSGSASYDFEPHFKNLIVARQGQL